MLSGVFCLGNKASQGDGIFVKIPFKRFFIKLLQNLKLKTQMKNKFIAHHPSPKMDSRDEACGKPSRNVFHVFSFFFNLCATRDAVAFRKMMN